MKMKHLIFAALTFISASGCQQNGKATDKGKATSVGQNAEEGKPAENPALKWNDIGAISGKVTIEGSLASPTFNNRKIYLYETEGKESYPIDSVKIANNAFKFGPTERMIGVYKLAFDNDNTVEMVLNPNENEGVLKVEIKGPGRLEAMTVFPNSQDNKAWQEYVRSEKKFQGELRNLRTQRGQAANKDEFDSQIYAKDDERIGSHMGIADRNPGTFTAKIMHRLRSPEHKTKGRYWEDIDFSDRSYIRSQVFNDRIQDFMRNHSGGKEDGFMSCVDLLMEKAKADERVFEFVLYTVLEGFYSSGMDAVCTYILDSYYFGDACGEIELSELSKVKASRIKNLQIGNTPPDFTLTSSAGKKINLKAESAKNKYTLVFFWASWCHKCEGEIPMLKPVYAQHRAKGFEVIGVSVDTDESTWKTALQSNNMPWPQVCEFGGWKSPVSKAYQVNKTPNMFLLDKEMKIVLKPGSVAEVKAFLDKNM
jgi:peroxiredoxin